MKNTQPHDPAATKAARSLPPNFLKLYYLNQPNQVRERLTRAFKLKGIQLR